MKTYKGYVTELKDNQVFVFGSNLDGFHGGGAAGFASFGSGVNWRSADYYNKPKGWKGKWNVKGVGEGYQEGEEGKSYALPTVVHAGQKRSLNDLEIRLNIEKLYDFAKKNPELEFMVAYCHDGSRLLNGYDIEEMANLFAFNEIPDNIVFEEKFSELIEKVPIKINE
jgi:hypothetical protein